MPFTDKKLSTLQIRTLSSLVLAPIVLGIIYLGGVWFQVFGAFILVRSLYEWARMSKLSERKWVLGFSGGLYILVTLTCLYLIRMFDPSGLWLFASFLLTVWASDTGAYFTGKLIGGPKMAPKISPNKTWAGLGGSMVWGGLAHLASALFILLFFQEFAFISSDDLPADHCIDKHAFEALGFVPSFQCSVAYGIGVIQLFLIGFILGLVGQAGDLLISAMKRHVNVKDTGQLIPGHGGVLDRIDAMLLAAPCYYLSLSFFGII